MTEKNEHPEKVQFFDEKLYVASFVYTNVVITIWNSSGKRRLFCVLFLNTVGITTRNNCTHSKED